MSNSLAPVIKQQFSLNGQPIGGGKLYAYLAGTSTPISTWKDQSDSNENQFPITLNSNGECDLWLNPDISYKFKLCNAANVELWTVDNVKVASGGSVPTSAYVRLDGSSVMTGPLFLTYDSAGAQFDINGIYGETADGNFWSYTSDHSQISDNSGNLFFQNTNSAETTTSAGQRFGWSTDGIPNIYIADRASQTVINPNKVTTTDGTNTAVLSTTDLTFNDVSISATISTIEDNINGLFGTKSYQNTSKKSCGIIIPAYFYPSGGYIDSNYTSLCDLARSYRDIPTIAAINPSNGPGTVVDGNFTAALEMMTGAGIVPIGYISTAYMGRDLSAVESDMLTWKTLYPQIRGIWVDEMVNFATSAYTIEQIVSYYNAIYIYAKQTLGLEYVFGNPGATYDIALWYGEVADNITYYENSGFPTETFMKQDGNFDGALIQVPTKAKSAVVYNISAYDNSASSSVAMMKKYCSFLYVTNDNLPNPYDTVSPYLENIYRDLNVDLIINPRILNTSATPGSIQFDGYDFFITVNDY